MAKESVEKRIQKITSSLGVSDYGAGYEQATAKLRKICAELGAGLSSELARAIVVSLQPGFQANMGQQLNVVVEIPDRRYQDTLFRAYVPLSGQPVQLDFYGEEPIIAQTPEEMEDAIVEFLDRAEIKSRLNDYRELAR